MLKEVRGQCERGGRHRGQVGQKRFGLAPTAAEGATGMERINPLGSEGHQLSMMLRGRGVGERCRNNIY